jgi:2-desacetyl-2-hydroxyethyl bacteriochlorophyllide A dehydrogenase
MKAVQLIQPGKALELREVPVPQTGPDDVLVRVKAAGICHSDAHYRAGVSPVHPLPMTLGHEVAGLVERVGENVLHLAPGNRVCVHYLATCGQCEFCLRNTEQFCVRGQMIGKHRDGGYAEFICVPSRSVFLLPEGIPFEHASIMMCSSATSLHALNKARFKPGESVAIFGFGGLGFSALQLAKALGCGDVYVVDLNAKKLAMAEQYGAIPINAKGGDPVAEIQRATKGKGIDVSLELIGLPATMDQAVRCLGNFGRAALVGITRDSFPVSPYTDVINKEAEIIGVSDHLAAELPVLMDFAKSGKLKFPPGVVRTIPLDAKQINDTLDGLQQSTDQIRTVIMP